MLYEFVYLARPDLSETQLDEINTKIADVLSSYQGSVDKISNWQLRNLAYKINKNKKAHYRMLNITTNPEGLKELIRVLSVNDNILRTLAIKIEEQDESICPLEKNTHEHKGSSNSEENIEEQGKSSNV